MRGGGGFEQRRPLRDCKKKGPLLGETKVVVGGGVFLWGLVFLVLGMCHVGGYFVWVSVDFFLEFVCEKGGMGDEGVFCHK